MASCLEAGGARVTPEEQQPEFEFVVARSKEGDAIFVVNMPKPNLSEQAIQALKREKKKSGLGGILITTTLNSGFTLVGVIGHEGINASVPSAVSEKLAKECAVRPSV
jgi:hypothetical protein